VRKHFYETYRLFAFTVEDFCEKEIEKDGTFEIEAITWFVIGYRIFYSRKW